MVNFAQVALPLVAVLLATQVVAIPNRVVDLDHDADLIPTPVIDDRF